MRQNYLEQLLSEWYEINGYFIRRNVMVDPRPNGGYECELDIIAFHPSKNHLVHIEPSMDAMSWKKREERYKKKFEAGIRHIPTLFEGLKLPNKEKIDQIAVFVFASKGNHKTIGGGEIKLLSDYFEEIFEYIKRENPKIGSRAIPEQYPILRSFQFVFEYRDDIKGTLFEK